ncbi:MAG: 16S rRNA (uracil(1498)-N(3))-methyltransferase [Gammaproteobacteria bacterium]|nr:16S rRNA (uracil(1498)-N(3))-methyltransferase [Gammaproteobacteria bacterium]
MSTRLFVSRALSNGAVLELQGEQARYLARVLRARTGETICVFNAEDGEWTATIQSIDKSGVELRIESRNETATESPLRIHLVQGISRGERMDFVVQKATELGVKRISPVFTEYGVVKLDDKRAAKRRGHWQHVSESACEQCGRTRPPLIDAPLPLNHWFGARDAAGSTQLVLQPGAKTALVAVDAPRTKLCLLIGPEGGFSDKEFGDARAAGFQAVSLGPRTLRTETAALAALAVAQSVWGDI